MPLGGDTGHSGRKREAPSTLGELKGERGHRKSYGKGRGEKSSDLHEDASSSFFEREGKSLPFRPQSGQEERGGPPLGRKRRKRRDLCLVLKNVCQRNPLTEGGKRVIRRALKALKENIRSMKEGGRKKKGELQSAEGSHH